MIQTLKHKPKKQREDELKARRARFLKKYGVDHPAKLPWVHQKIMRSRKNRCYFIDGNWFDSLPEFCFYVVCRDFGIEVQCHPHEKTLAYFDASGKIHHYYPDFYLPKLDRIVEIKGSHFFEGKDETKSLT